MVEIINCLKMQILLEPDLSLPSKITKHQTKLQKPDM